MSDLPEPLVPPEVDLRGMDWMPLYGQHLFGSVFNGACSDAGWRAGVTLWWAAWTQQPAASLPSDDAALCRLADLGRDLAAWNALKGEALHGFILCSDGRLYHKFLSKIAIESWGKRMKARERKAAWRGRNGDGTGTERGRNGDVPALSPQDTHGTSPLTGQDRTGQDIKDLTPIPRRRSDTRAREQGALPGWLNIAAWQEFERHRQQIRKPLTDLARAKNLRVLEGMTHEQQQAIVDRTIANRWTGLFRPRAGDNEDARRGKSRTQHAFLAAIERYAGTDG